MEGFSLELLGSSKYSVMIDQIKSQRNDLNAELQKGKGGSLLYHK